MRLRAGGDLADVEDLCKEAPLPALVTLGCSGRGWLLAKLEAGGVVAVAGDTERARRLLLAAALELEGARWAEYVGVELVGFGLEGSDGAFEWVHQPASLEQLRLDRAAQRSDETRRGAGYDSTLAGRVAGHAAGDWMSVTLALCASPPPDDQAEALVASLVPGRGRCAHVVVVAGEVEGAHWRLGVSSDGQLSVPPLEATVTAQAISSSEAGDVVRLLGVANQTTDGEAPEKSLAEGHDAAVGRDPSEHEVLAAEACPPAMAAQASPAVSGGLAPAAVPASSLNGDGEDPGPYEEEPYELELRLLGPVEVVCAGDTPVAFERPKDLELVAVLARYGERGADSDRLACDLWPERRVSPHTLENTVTRARRALGARDDGSSFLPRVGGGSGRLYRLDFLGFVTDYGRFQARVAHARRQRDPAAAMDTLREALELVRGLPYDMPSGYEWAHGGIRSRIQSEVADVAHWLATLYLEAGDSEGARWAAQRGQIINPYSDNERLGRCEMRAGYLHGDLAEVRTIYRRLREDLDPNEDLHPETKDLYRQLTTGRG